MTEELIGFIPRYLSFSLSLSLPPSFFPFPLVPHVAKRTAFSLAYSTHSRNHQSVPPQLTHIHTLSTSTQLASSINLSIRASTFYLFVQIRKNCRHPHDRAHHFGLETLPCDR